MITLRGAAGAMVLGIVWLAGAGVLVGGYGFYRGFQLGYRARELDPGLAPADREPCRHLGTRSINPDPAEYAPESEDRPINLDPPDEPWPPRVAPVRRVQVRPMVPDREPGPGVQHRYWCRPACPLAHSNRRVPGRSGLFREPVVRNVYR